MSGIEKGAKRKYPRHLLWPLANFFWNINLPYIWRLGNVVSDIRYWLYDRFGWEWV